MGPPVKERYNAKARQSVLGGSGHKKRRKAKDKQHVEGSGDEAPFEGFDSNAEILPEKTEKTKLEMMRRDLVGDDQNMSSKKRKRLDSYIAKKLKQESRLESLAILAQHALPSHIPSALKSTSTLGQNPLAPQSAQEMAAKKEDLSVRRALNKQIQKGVGQFDDMDDEDEDDFVTKEALGTSSRDQARIRQEEKRRTQHGVVEMAGEEDQEMQSRNAAPGPSRKRQKMAGVTKANWSAGLISTQPAESESDFDSSDSDYDSDVEPTAPEVSEQAPDTFQEKTTALAVPPDVITSVESKAESIVVAPPAPSGIGSALARGSDGQVIGPTIVVRQKKHTLTRMTGTEKRTFAKRQRLLDALEAGDMDMIAGDDDDDDEHDEEDSDDGSDEDMSDGEDGDEEDSDSEFEEGDVESEGEDEEEEGDAEEQSVAPIDKAANFKAWALKQTDRSLAPDLLAQNRPFDESSTAANALPHIGPLAGTFNIPEKSLLHRDAAEPSVGKVSGRRPKITRRESVSESRQQLPVVAEEQVIMEAILLNPVVVICGETGSGKTTQVPQMLYEAGFGFPGSDNPGMIAITQPRRVAAVSLSVRVASELNLPPKSSIVAHQIRYQSTTSAQTAIKFMTDGVLLRELANDFLLKRYSVVIVDEAHERGVNTDVLVGVLSRVAKLREKLWRERKDGVKPLRIIIMSATLRVADFAENKTLFSETPPIIHIGARQHPVTVHFNRRTTHDYVNEAYKKVAKIHARLPNGGILVFLTGQGEITALCRKLERKYGKKAIEDRHKAKTQTFSGRDEAARRWEEGEDLPITDTKTTVDGNLELEDLDLGLEDDLAADVDDGNAELDPEALDSEDEDDMDEKLGIDKEDSQVPLHVLPLYSLLSNEQQLKVFQPPPDGTRLVIVATNVAETSLTIPGIRYVVDSGRVKERQYDAATGVQSFQVTWVSKASASQRAGRAGRTGPGHCYRLYSSAVFEDGFEAFSQPEILRMPIEGVVLQMKSMNIDAVVNFPFPTPPDRHGLRAAETVLTRLGALEATTSSQLINGVEKKGTVGGRITDLGKAMANFPVTPRFAKMLVIGQQHGCLPYVIAIVAALSVGDPFMREEALGQGPDAESDDEDEDAVPEINHIKSGDIRAKEERKAKRRAFFKSQAVSKRFFRDISKLVQVN